MGTIKDRNDMDLTEAEDTKKRWQEYTEKLYKKDLCNPLDCNMLGFLFLKNVYLFVYFLTYSQHDLMDSGFINVF